MANAMAKMIGVDEDFFRQVAVKLEKATTTAPELELADLAESFDNKKEAATAGFITGFLAKAYTLTQDFEDSYGRPQPVETNVYQRDQEKEERKN